MQLFECPFCGLRDEREFHFLGEMGKVRPDTAQGVPDTDWAHYLHMQRNDRGHVREVWMHMPCGELFGMERDSVTMQVAASHALRKEAT